MPTSMFGQLMADPVISRRLELPWDRVVILERLARAGGATRWFFARSRADLEQAMGMFRGGSCVSFYFARQMKVEADSESVRQEMFDEMLSVGELVLGYPPAGNVEISMEIISGPGELGENLMMHREGELVVWGKWPDRANDGLDAITVDLVDQDGVIRSHPH